MAYSIDFREKTLKHFALHGNLSLTTRTFGITNRTFGITNRTLYQWLTLKQETGSLQHQVKGGNHTKVNKEELLRLTDGASAARRHFGKSVMLCFISNLATSRRRSILGFRLC